MQFAGFAILVVVNCYLGGEKSARNVILRNAMVVGCTGNKQMKSLFEPPLAHTKDPQTSFKAAEKMIRSGKLKKQQKSVLNIIIRYSKKHKDFTPLELTDGHWTALYFAIQRRKNELKNKGCIETTGEVRNGMEVWRLV